MSVSCIDPLHIVLVFQIVHVHNVLVFHLLVVNMLFVFHMLHLQLVLAFHIFFCLVLAGHICPLHVVYVVQLNPVVLMFPISSVHLVLGFRTVSCTPGVAVSYLSCPH